MLLSYSKCKHLQTETNNSIGNIRGKMEIKILREESNKNKGVRNIIHESFKHTEPKNSATLVFLLKT
jgi:hypothetical protein